MNGSKLKKSEKEKFYENSLRPATAILANVFATGLPRVELCEKIFEIVVKYSEKAYEDYRFVMPYFDTSCTYPEAEIKSVAMCLDLNRQLGIKMSRDDVTDLVLMILFRINEPAVSYEEKHEYLDRFVPGKNFYPVSDLMYALVIVVFTVYMQYLLVLRSEGETIEFDADNFCNFINELEMLSFEKVYVMIDNYVHIHRKTLTDMEV